MIKIGVIGVGKMGSKHLKKLLILRKKYEVVGIYDENTEYAYKIGQLYSVKVFDKYTELLKQVNFVAITASSVSHYNLIQKCLKYEIGIFVEKPMVTCLEQAEELIKKDSNIGAFFVGYIERYNPILVQFLEMIKCKKIRRISLTRNANSIRSRDTDVLLDLTIHDLDLACHILGDGLELYENIKTIEHNGVVDAISLSLFKEGCEVDINTSRVAKYNKRVIMAIVEDSVYQIDLLEKKILVRDRQGEKICCELKKKFGVDSIVNEWLYIAQNFVKGINKDDLYRSYELHKIIAQIYSYISKNRRKVSEF